MGTIVIAPLNEAYCYVFAEEAVERDLAEEFSWVVPGAEFMKRGWRKGWNGKVYLFNRKTNMIPVGIIPRVTAWADKNGHVVERKIKPFESTWEPADTTALFETYPTPKGLEVRDYQREAITWAMHKQRCTLISPTGSGKSLMLYYIVRARMQEGPVLLVVPSISLVSQMFNDWKNYGWKDAEKYVHRITGGVSKETSKPVTISTWQSVYQEEVDWFSRYDTLLMDECHLGKAASLKGIGDKMPNCSFRVGVTGTLDDTKSHRLVVEGILGKGYKVAKTADLQTQGHLSPIRIQSHHLIYSKNDKWLVEQQFRKYQEEIDYIVQHKDRMRWLVDFVGQLQGNVLILFQFIEKHGEPLHQALQDAYGQTRPIHYVVGSVDGDDREEIRRTIETQSNAIIAASYGVFSVGTDVKKIHHVVFASPSKSRYRVLQSIGRGLRLHATKSCVYVHDIVDRIDTTKYCNYATKHWKQRKKFYDEETFKVEEFGHEIGATNGKSI